MAAPRQRATRRRVRMVRLDVGLERIRMIGVLGDGELKPFLGVGLGVRAYSVAGASGTDDERIRLHPAGHGALGVEFQSGPLSLKIDVRGYLASYAGLSSGRPRPVRMDAMLTVGVVYHLR